MLQITAEEVVFPFRSDGTNRGVGNETYDFYLLLKSERMDGWRLPANLKLLCFVKQVCVTLPGRRKSGL
jgi:hypothetical protein